MRNPKKSHALIAARQRLGLTQLQTAKMLGMSLRTYCHWEAGTTVPREGLGSILDSLASLPPPAPCVLCGHVKGCV